jgi:hypothetical protein
MIFFESRVASVEWRADISAVELRWKTFAKGDEFKEALNKGLELAQMKGAKKWLGDTSQMSAIAPEDQQWSNTDWFPRALAAGLQKMAVVMPKSALAKMSVQSIINKFDTMELRNFVDKADAVEWLK